MSEKIKLSVFGDSILAGAVTGTKPGFMFELIPENSLAIACEKLDWQLDNHSVFGSTITKGWRRLKKFLEKVAAGEEAKPDFLVIEFGGNDCDRDWAVVSEKPEEETPVRVPLSEYLSTLDTMVKAVRELNITPVFMISPPLAGASWVEHICTGHNRENILSFINRHGENPGYLCQLQECYCLEMKNYAVENHVQYVDIRQAFEAEENPENLMCRDGIHPNREGYKFMAGIWETALKLITKEF